MAGRVFVFSIYFVPFTWGFNGLTIFSSIFDGPLNVAYLSYFLLLGTNCVDVCDSLIIKSYTESPM